MRAWAPTTTGLRMALEPRARARVRAGAFRVRGRGVRCPRRGGRAHLLVELAPSLYDARLYGWAWDITVKVPDADTQEEIAACKSDFAAIRDPEFSAVASVLSRRHRDRRTADPRMELLLVPRDHRSDGGFRTRPRGPGEIALGAATLDHLGKEIGDSVGVQSEAGTVRYRVVGRVVLPTMFDAQPLDDGATFDGTGFAGSPVLREETPVKGHN